MESGRAFTIRSERKIQRIDITKEVKEAVAKLCPGSGWALISVPHTTAGVTIGENWDPDVGSDLEAAFARWVPGVSFRHEEGNSPAHFLSEAIGNSRMVVVEDGEIRIGRWQGIFFLELDGPRTRQVTVDVMRSVGETRRT